MTQINLFKDFKIEMAKSLTEILKFEYPKYIHIYPIEIFKGEQYELFLYILAEIPFKILDKILNELNLTSYTNPEDLNKENLKYIEFFTHIPDKDILSKIIHHIPDIAVYDGISGSYYNYTVNTLYETINDIEKLDVENRYEIIEDILLNYIINNIIEHQLKTDIIIKDFDNHGKPEIYKHSIHTEVVINNTQKNVYNNNNNNNKDEFMALYKDDDVF